MESWKLALKRLSVWLHEIVAIVIIAGALVLRLLLIANNWPSTDSDEGTMGLEAIRIAFQGAHPIFFYGQNYMGVIEAYLGAFFFRFFGVSVFSLRLGMILVFILFMVAFYFLVSLLYSKKLALVSLLLVAVGAPPVVSRDVFAVGGFVETLLFGTLSLLIAVWLAFTANQERRQQQGWRRGVAYLGWGLAVGLGLWSHVLVAPFVLAGGLILLIFCLREWRTWAIPALVVGLVAGGFPLIVYNLKAPLSQNSLAVALSIQGGSDAGSGVFVKATPPLQHLVGTFLYAVPVATGISPICSLKVLPFFGPNDPQTLSCSLAQGAWSVVYMLLLLSSVVITLVALGKLLHKYRSQRQGWSEEQRQGVVIQLSRLLLIFCGLLTIVVFYHSELAAAKPNSTRYLVGLLIVLPAAIWPLWTNNWRTLRLFSIGTFWMVCRYSLLLFAGVVIFSGTFAIFAAMPRTSAVLTADQRVIHDLEQRGFTRFYTEYWTCDRLSFQSKGELVCADINEQFNTNTLNRVPGYVALVRSDSQAIYLLPAGAYTRAASRNARLKKDFHHFQLDGYTVYVPNA